MTGSPRPVAAVCLAVLGLLAVGAIVLSLETAPTYGQGRLHAAAAATAKAAGFQDFVAAAPESGAAAVPTSSAGLSVVADLAYQAPDRVIILTRLSTGEEIQVTVGTQAWASTDGGRSFVALRARQPGTSIGLEQAGVILALPRRLAVEDVPVHVAGNVFTFSTHRLDVIDAFGLADSGVPASGSVTDVRATVTSQGYLGDVAASVHFDHRTLVIIDEFSRIGNVTVPAPAPSSVTGSLP